MWNDEDGDIGDREVWEDDYDGDDFDDDGEMWVDADDWTMALEGIDDYDVTISWEGESDFYQ